MGSQFTILTPLREGPFGSQLVIVTVIKGDLLWFPPSQEHHSQGQDVIPTSQGQGQLGAPAGRWAVNFGGVYPAAHLIAIAISYSR